MNNALKNAKVIRRYVEYLREAKKRSESTIRAVERAIRLYEVATNEADLAAFDRHKAKQFATWLEENGKSSRQIYQFYNHLKAFFHWLAFQSGYKSRIDVSDIEYLSLDRKRMQEVTSPDIVDWPSKEHVVNLTKTIEPLTEIDKRDRALISFLLLSGMRDMAIATLPLGCFNPHTLEVIQYPDQGVATKFSKRFVSRLFVFDEGILTFVKDWARYLTEERQFSSKNPLFPRTRVFRSEETSEFSASDVEPVFWKSAGPIREILKTRSEKAELVYYKPHSFRHAAAQLALRQCSSPEEIRAVSQNLGHEHVATTLTSYGKLEGDRVQQVIDSIDFQASNAKKINPQFIRQLQAFIDQQQKEVDS